VALFWTLYGAATLTYALAFAARLTLSPAFRARYSTGGRDWRLILAIVVILGLAGLVSGRLLHGSSWPLVPAFAVLICVAARRRRNLSALPADDL
jgi:hypothetical protein